MWGKIYGQWLCGSAVLVYDFDKFVPSEILDKMTQCKVTSFCAPPTMYRFMLPENLGSRDFSHLQYCAVAGEPLNIRGVQPVVRRHRLQAHGGLRPDRNHLHYPQ